jgi:hypothetical protein
VKSSRWRLASTRHCEGHALSSHCSPDTSGREPADSGEVPRNVVRDGVPDQRVPVFNLSRLVSLHANSCRAWRRSRTRCEADPSVGSIVARASVVPHPCHNEAGLLGTGWHTMDWLDALTRTFAKRTWSRNRPGPIPKLRTRVRFPSPAPRESPGQIHVSGSGGKASDELT